MSAGARRAVVRVRRGGRGESPRYDRWEVPYEDGDSVLDALLWVQCHRDPTLAVRCSCLSANACKTCTALINGKAGYLCTARLGDAPVTCEPLPGKPLLRDLVVELNAPGELQLEDRD